MVKIFVVVTAMLLLGLAAVAYGADRRLRRTFQMPLAIAIVVTQAAACLSPHLAVFDLAMFLSVPMLARRASLIAPFYLFLLLTTPAIGTPIGVAGVYLVSFDSGVALGLGALLATFMRAGRGSRRSWAWDLPAFALFILFVVGYGRGSSATNILRTALDNGLQMFIPYFVVSRTVRTGEDVRLALFGLVAACASLSMLALYEALHGWPIYRSLWTYYGIPLGSGASVKLRAGLLRSPGPFAEPTGFAFALCFGTLAAISIRSLFRSRQRQAIVVVLLLLGICAPQSRGAWLGLAVGVVAVQIYAGRMIAFARTAAYAAIGVIAVLAAGLVSTRIGSMLGFYSQTGGSDDYRATLFSRGVEEVARFPLLGRPLSDVVYAMRDMTQGEGIVDFVNSYLFIALITGIIGLVVFAGSLLIPLAKVWTIRSRARRAPEIVDNTAYLFGALLAVMVMLGYTSIGGKTTIMLTTLLALIAATVTQVRTLRVVRAPRPARPSRVVAPA